MFTISIVVDDEGMTMKSEGVYSTMEVLGALEEAKLMVWDGHRSDDDEKS